MSNSKVVLTIVGGLAIVVTLVLFTAVYISKSSQLAVLEDRAAETGRQARQLQTELAAIKQKLEAKEIEVQALERKNSQSELEMERAAVKTQKLRENVETVGKCLKGTFGLILAARREDYGQMRALLGAMEDSCNKSGSILDDLEKSDSKSRKVSTY